MARTKVCLINPPTTAPTQRLVYFPTALLALGGVLKKCGVKGELWDFDLYFKKVGNATEAEFLSLLRRGVDAVGTPIFAISSICSNLPMALWIAREIKAHRPDSLILFGGAQPSSTPLELLQRFPFIDAVVVGEGEVTLAEMAREGFDRRRIATLPGVASRIDGEPALQSKRPLVEDMDDLPLPDYSLLDFEAYRKVQGAFVPHVEVGRGCPFHCNFCSTALMWEQDFRVKSPRRILAEMEWLNSNFGFRRFDFIHDNFTTSRKFVLDFCDYMLAHNGRRLEWLSSSRTDCLDAPRLERMHAAGLRGLFFGIESGAERMQQIIGKGLKLDRFEPLLQRGKELGIQMITAFILGFPEERAEDLDRTVERALHYKCEGGAQVFFSKLSALTGTRIYRDHLASLEETSQPSCTSPQNYGLPYVRELIREHPDLFASFYHVPHPEFSKEWLFRFTEFANLLVENKAEVGRLLTERLGLAPHRLFDLWDAWAAERSYVYFDYRSAGTEEFKSRFAEFLEQRILESRETSVAGYSEGREEGTA